MTKDLPAKEELIPKAIELYSKGDITFKQLAEEHGISRRTLYLWLLAGIGDKQYSEVVTKGLVSRLADADDALEEAADKVAVARARAQASFARMDLERRRPELYGAKQEVRHVTPEPLRIVTIVANAPQIAPQHGNNGIVIDVSPTQSVDK